VSSGWSPFLSSSTSDAEQNDAVLAREIDMLERAVRDKGEVGRRDLARLVGAKYWGPGRFGRALRAALRQGRVVRSRRGYYAASSRDDAR
jgi:hypothetical protein